MAAFSIIRLLPLMALGFFCLELASIILVGQRIGVLATLLLIIADIILGVSVIRTAGANAMSKVRMPFRAPGFEARLAGGMALRVTAGMLFMLPGFFSDLLALVALAPPVQGWLARRFKPTEGADFSGWDRRGPGGGRQSPTIIEGEVIEISGEIEELSRDGDGPRDTSR